MNYQIVLKVFISFPWMNIHVRMESVLNLGYKGMAQKELNVTRLCPVNFKYFFFNIK